MVHTHTPIASFIGRIAAWLAGVKCIIYHVRGTWWGTSVLGSVMMTCAEYFPGRITTHAFTVNCSDARDLVRYRIMGNSQVTCLHCGAGGIELESFNFNQYNEETRLRTRKDLSIHKDDLVVTFIGRLVRDKGVNELVRAMVQVRTKVPNAKLLLIGGVLTSERRDHAFDEDVETILLDPNFIAVGFRTDVARLLHASDIVVLPSYHEGFGTVIAEAAAMGKPAVMTATRGSYEVIVDGETGFRVPIAEVNPLAEAIEKILVDTDLRNRMGVAARKLAESRFDANKVFQVIEQRYRVLLGATAGVESTL